MTTSTFDDISDMVEGRLKAAEFRFQEELKKERKEWKEECEILLEGLRHRGLPVRASDDTHIPKVSIPSETEEEEDVIYDPPPAADQRNAGKRFMSTMGRMLGLGRYSAMTDLNTETVSMSAVATVVSTDTSRLQKYLDSIGALLLVLIQLYTLWLVIMESTFPKCTSMSDCRSGTFCGGTGHSGSNNKPFCRDCAGIEYVTDLNTTTVEEVCPAVFPANKWEHREYIEFDHEELWMKAGTDSTLQKCISFLHCNATDLDAANPSFYGQCDFIALNRSKFDGGTWLMVGFLALLWALPISQDVEEAATEERVMDHHLAGSLNIPAEIVRLALRMRRCMLPVFATAATLVLLITDDISAKNIILNFLSITFITEADNVLAVLFLGKRHRELMDKTAKEAHESKEFHDSKVAFFWACVQGLYCVVILIIVLYIVDEWVKNCDSLEDVLIQCFGFFLYLIVVVGQGVYRGCVKAHQETKCVRILSGLIEFFRNLLVGGLGDTFVYALRILLNGCQEYAALADFSKGTIICLLIVIGLETCKRKCCTRSQE